MFEALTTDERQRALRACAIIKTVGRASVSCLQRWMNIGYLQAAMIMECLEDEGVIGASDRDFQRPVYADKLNEALQARTPAPAAPAKEVEK